MQSGPFGEALQALEKMRGQGKLRFYGIGTEVPEDAPCCLAAAGISSVQLGFGVLDLPALDQGTLAAAQQRGLAVIARGCFGGGLLKDGLAGEQLRAATTKWPRIEALRELGQRLGRSPLDLAFQFCRGTAGVSVTLLGMRNESHLRDNLSHVAAPPLRDSEYQAVLQVARLDAPA
jgi:aryl-alcohol dehydrogenase-like predicted oxidoreductase